MLSAGPMVAKNDCAQMLDVMPYMHWERPISKDVDAEMSDDQEGE